VKVRGYRIELGEIESVVGAHPSVGQCVVLAREDQPGIQRLVAYVTPRPGETLSIPELRHLTREKLPDYMTPAAWVPMPQLPRTPAGKIDRKSLPIPDHERPELEVSYVAPETAVERKLATIWQSALGIKKIGIDDNYFELGAESLLTARVFARITREFGRQISPTALFVAPTIRELSVLLSREEQSAKPWTCLVPIRSQGTKPPLFCIHGGAGSILFYYNFSSHLAADQPVYALQSQGLYGDAAPHTRIEEMAEHYIREIRSVQAHGPYRLVGYCFGMIVAYEMAQRLRAAGEEVALLASINGTAPLYQNGPGAGRTRQPQPGLLGRVRWAFAWRRNLIKARITDQRRRYYLTRGKPVPAGLRDMFFRDMNFYAERDYTALPYPGKVSIFRAKGLYHDPDLGWKPFLTGELDVYDIPGQHRNHRSIVDEPIVRDLARTFDDVLRSCRS
jgi:thioesterase domain-containing protein/acyl carrier protein